MRRANRQDVTFSRGDSKQRNRNLNGIDLRQPKPIDTPVGGNDGTTHSSGFTSDSPFTMVTLSGADNTLYVDDVQYATEFIPELSTIVLAALGLLSMGIYGYRRKKYRLVKRPFAGRLVQLALDSFTLPD
jgi:hypothetical protein